MFSEDNTGFINFPLISHEIVAIDSGKTLVYIAVFDIYKQNKLSKISNVNLFSP